MSMLAQNISNSWQQLGNRQKKVLAYAAPIILLLFLCLLLSPLFTYYQTSKKSYQKLVSSYQWLAQQQALITSAPSSCRHLSVIRNSSELQNILDQQLTEKQILDPVWEQSSGGWLLKVQEVDGQHLLGWLEQATCQGLLLKAIVLEKQASGKLNANIEMVVL